MNTPLITSSTALSQRGMATLTTALMLLIAITLMTFSSARVGIVEQQIAANDYRAKQALHAAQAGLDRAVYDSNVLGVGAPTIAVAALVYTAVTALAAVGTGPATSYQYAYRLPPDVAAGGTLALVTITARGFSDDSVASKTLTQYIKRYSPLPKVPSNPLSTGDRYASDSANIRIVNNVTGPTGIAIQAQRQINTGSSGGNPHVITQAKVSDVLTSGEGRKENGVEAIACATCPGGVVDGQVNTAAEKDAFFTNAFGTTKADIEAISKPVVDCNNARDCNTKLGNNADGSAKAPFIVVTGETKLNSTTVIGSPTQPVVLIINGNLELSGNVTIYGFIYVTGETKLEKNSALNVHGSLISEKEVEIKKDSVVNITYNKYNTRSNPGGPDFYVKAPGTWNDF